jgi:fructan beta-fructosidase
MRSKLILLVTLFFFATCQPSGTSENPAGLKTTEALRPQFHFTPQSGWMNDPNGMVYYEGEYHLFYQYYPDSTVWGPMHWGHAVSKDMIRWERLPIALYPDSLGYIFSGSAVIDWKNTSGLGTEQAPAMVAIFTYHDPVGEQAGRIDLETQGIAYSIDKGRTWTKYDRNPVLPNPGIRDFRDPKVSWNEVSHQWVMTLAVKDHIEFYGSPDLKKWNKLSEFGKSIGAHGGVWECPDLFPLKDEQGNIRWVLFVSINPGGPQGGSATQYFVGDFDGKKFIPTDTTIKWMDYGADNYAGVTWSDIPASDGRRLFIGWMSNWQYANIVPATDWRSATTLPRSLTLKNRSDHVWLASTPVIEFENLRGEPVEYQDVLAAIDTESKPIPLPKSEIEIIIQLHRESSNNDFEIELSNAKNEKLLIGLSGTLNQYYVDRTLSGNVDFSDVFAGRHMAKRIGQNDDIAIRLVLDTSSLELFTDDGTLVMTELFFPSEPYNSLKINTASRGVVTKSVQLYPLKSIW